MVFVDEIGYHDYGNETAEENGAVGRAEPLTPAEARKEQVFPKRLHYMLLEMEKEGNDHIVSWRPHGRCFIVHKPKEFAKEMLPLWFKQSKFASFQRQLNLYGFRRLSRGIDKGAYYHELFLRGKDFLCDRIRRFKVKGTGIRMPSSPETEPDFYSGRYVPLPPSKYVVARRAAAAAAASAAAASVDSSDEDHDDQDYHDKNIRNIRGKKRIIARRADNAVATTIKTTGPAPVRRHQVLPPPPPAAATTAAVAAAVAMQRRLALSLLVARQRQRVLLALSQPLIPQQHPQLRGVVPVPKLEEITALEAQRILLNNYQLQNLAGLGIHDSTGNHVLPRGA